MVKKQNILIFLSFTLLIGCNSLNLPFYFENSAKEPIDIEILRPADTTIDLSIKKVLVFVKPGLKPIINITEGKKKFPKKLVVEDLPEAELHSMADLLSQSPRFTLLEPSDSSLLPRYTRWDWDDIDSICRKTGVDACIMLSKQELVMGHKNAFITDGETFYTGLGNIMVHSTYDIYSPAERIAIKKTVATGVEFQTDANQASSELLEGIEPLVHDYAMENGEKFAGWIAPVWQKDTREYFLYGNPELESVKDLIKSEQWEKVYDIWRRNSHSNNQQVAQHALYNSIISYEMEGKLDSAMIIANEAYKKYKLEEIVDYGYILQERIRETYLVKTQLGLNEK